MPSSGFAIYDRPDGRHRHGVRVLAVLLLGATLVLSFLGFPPTVTAQTVWKDPTGLAALAGTAATGRVAPEPLNPELDGSFPVSVSTSPTLVWKEVPAGVAQATFSVVSLAATAPKAIWTSTVAVGSDRVARARVPAGLLTQGRSYAWAVESSADTSIARGPFAITIDAQRAGSQPVHSFAGLSVAEGTGELIFGYTGPAVPTLAGPVGWSLIHRPTTPARVGLPAGWDLSLSGSSGWESLSANGDGSVTLVAAAGGSVSFTKTASTQWRPRVGRYASAGQRTLLTQNADGTFSATDENRTVTVFSAPTPTEVGRPVKVWSLAAPVAQQAWSEGRLRTLTDPVTSQQIVFTYGGESGCPTQADPGFIVASSGMLCAVADWTGAVEAFEYVQTKSGPQIGRIVSGLGLGKLAQSEDIAWDASGRIAALRSARVATAIASGVVAGLGEQDDRAMTKVAYDAKGRVASLTAPVGFTSGAAQPTWLQGRASQSFTYAPFTVTVNGRVAEQVWLDPNSLQVTKMRNESGNVVTYAYDGMGNQVRTVDEASGTVTETQYDAYGRTIAQRGPSRNSLDAANAPRTSTAYDQNEQGEDWRGLATRYWDNAGFNGVPTGGTTGPVMPGGTAPVTGLSMNWASNPAGGTGSWAARLTGIYEAPADGAYVLTNTTAAKLWANGRLCQPECKATLAKGTLVSLQIDVVSADGAPAGVNALVTTPDGKRAPIPTAQTRPNYGLATSSAVREIVGGVPQMLTTKFVFDPVTTQLLATESPSGARQTRTYEPYDPAKGQWGRSTGVTDASGKTTTMSYYGLNATAADCAGKAIPQNGQFASTTMPDGSVLSQVGTVAGGTVKAEGGGTTVCGSVGADGNSLVTTTTGIGPEVVVTSTPMLGDDPLRVQTTTTTQGVTGSERSRLDTNGNVLGTTDVHGTRTTREWDPATGKLTRIVETTAKGETRTIAYTYASNGEVATVAVNGTTTLTNEYAADGSLARMTLGNGAVREIALDANNNGRLVKTTFPDGTVISETSEHSPTGRLLSRTLSGPTGSATFTYTYNVDGRLVDTRLTGTIPTKATAWHSEYTGAEGKNGNRASKSWTMADGTVATTDFAYGPDNRLLSASGSIKGSVAYDAAGRATTVGGVSLAYDAAGHLLSAAQGNRTYTFGEQGTRTTLTQTENGATTTVTAISSGESLVLGADGMINAQVMAIAPGVTLLLDQAGAPLRWVYDDTLGNSTWSSKGNAAPTRTHLYAPGGEPISVARTSAPVTPVDLIVDSLGWAHGRGAATLRLATPLVVIGARVYTPAGGRWLQPDPDVNASFNAYEYAVGDPINIADPTGNAPWGAILGSIVAVVAGVAIGALTFGIGVGGTAIYGLGALAAQVALGAVEGAISSAAGELVAQWVDRGAGGIDWASVGIAAGIGAGLGAAAAGISGAVFKIILPKRRLQVLGGDITEEAGKTVFKKGSWRDGYAAMRQGYMDNEGLDVLTHREVRKLMFTTDSWAKRARNAARGDADGGFSALMSTSQVSEDVVEQIDARFLTETLDESIDQVVPGTSGSGLIGEFNGAVAGNVRNTFAYQGASENVDEYAALMESEQAQRLIKQLFK